MSTASEKPLVPPGSPVARLLARGPSGPVHCETARPVTLIGSRRDCHLPIKDPDVSKVHCAIVHTGPTLLVCDLCSRSGTFVNDQPVRITPLKAGDRLRIGTVVVDVEFVRAAEGDHDATVEPVRVAVGDHNLKLVADVTTSWGQPSGSVMAAALIGCRSACDIVIDTPDVSLVHALVFPLGGRPAIADLGSRSGTGVNKRRVQLAWLHDTDQLDIGGEPLAIACDVPPLPRPAEPPPEEAKEAEEAPGPAASARMASVAALARQARDTGKLDGVEDMLRVVLDDLSTTRGRLDARATDLERREAELETLAMLLELQSEHVEKLKTDLSQRLAEADAMAEEARERLSEAIAHEQAVTAAWQELDHWHESWEARHKARESGAASAAASKEGLPAGAPLVQPFPSTSGSSPSAREGGAASA